MCLVNVTKNRYIFVINFKYMKNKLIIKSEETKIFYLEENITVFKNYN